MDDRLPFRWSTDVGQLPLVEPLAEPPENPEDWTDEQWIAWLEATDPEPSEEREDRPPETLGARVIRSAGGTVLAAAMSGVAEIFYEDQEPDVVVMAETPTGSGDRGLTVTLDPEFPERSVVTFHPADQENPEAHSP